MKDTYYVTTPIYYVNAKPHIGHAYTTILADSFARFNRFLGNKAFYLTGTDEHGEKIERAAKEAGKTPQQQVDELVVHFKDVWKTLNISYDDFIRTTDERHKTVVHVVIRKLLKTGDIYMGKYEGWYCVPCESFWTKSQLVENACPDCKRAVNKIEEKNLFFKLSKYQDWLIEYLNENEDFVLPKGKRQEVLSFLKKPLEDLCISRSKKRMAWGIPFPEHDDYVVYVWFDALINYISAIGYSDDCEKFSSIWPADIHLMAKDILRQHAIYWPIMLKALDIELPRHVIAHGWWTIEGEKMSKSLGNIVDPFNMADKYGVDAFRYFMLREATMGSDGAYSEGLLISRLNSDLANDLGNLVHRTLSMMEKYFEGIIPDCDKTPGEHPLYLCALGLCSRLEKSMNEDFDPRSALCAIWELVTIANKYIEETKPWKLAKDPEKKSELATGMYALLEALRFIGVALYSFLPETAAHICAALNVPQETHHAEALHSWGGLKAGVRIQKGEPLFQKIINQPKEPGQRE